MSDNGSIDKLAETYSSDEEDAKAYQKAQSATIINQTRQINELRKKLEEISGHLETLTIENTKLKALAPESSELETEDTETIAIVQLALLRNYSMQRELALDEVKKFEILAKILISLRSKKPEKQTDTIGSLSNEELMEAMKNLG